MSTSNYSANQPNYRTNSRKLIKADILSSALTGDLDASASKTSNSNIKAQKAYTKDVDGELRFQTPGAASKISNAEQVSSYDQQVTADQEIANNYGKKAFANLNIEPNILSIYENSTYNFRFFIAREAATPETIASENIITIAETGATSFLITDVNISASVAPGPPNRNTPIDVLTFKILEPQGNRLFDHIRASVAALGLKDHIRAPYWLELSFKGYSAPGPYSVAGGWPTASTDYRATSPRSRSPTTSPAP